MIGWLSGQVLLRDPRSSTVILDVGGVGYEVRVSMQTLGVIPAEGSPCALWIYTHVREDIIALFGFASAAERELYLLLLGVPKVGPKNAIAVLGGLPIAELVACLARGEQGKLEKIPGIGKKTAEQILLSLKGKVDGLLPVVADADAPPPAPNAAEEALAEEAKAVLIGLGWRAREVDAALAKVAAASDGAGAGSGTLDEVVRRTLAQLMER